MSTAPSFVEISLDQEEVLAVVTGSQSIRASESVDDAGAVASEEGRENSDKGPSHLSDALRKNKRALLLHTVPVMWANMLSKLATSSVAAPQSQALRMSSSQFGLVLSAFFLTFSTLQYPSLYVATKVGERRWLAFNLVAMGGLTILKSGLPNFWSLALVNMGIGATQACVQPIMYRNMDKHLTAAETSSSWSLVYVSNTVGGIFFGPLAAVIMLAGWRYVYLVYGLYCALAGLVTWFCMMDSPSTTKMLTEDERAALLEAKQGSVGGGGKAKSMNAALKWWRTWYLGAMAFLFQQLIMAGTQFGPLIYYEYLQHHNPLGDSNQQQSRANFLLTASSIASVLASLSTGQLLKRLPEQRFWYGTILFALALALSALVSVVYATSTTLALNVTVFALAFGVAFGCTPLMDTLPVVFCNSEGLASGVFSIMTSFKGAAGLTAPLIFGALQEAVGAPFAFTSMAGFFFVAAMLYAGFFVFTRNSPFARRVEVKAADDKAASVEPTSVKAVNSKTT
jgi:MFS family permease